MEREKVIELAKKAGFDVSTTAGILQLGIDTGDDWFSCREEVLELIRLVEQETLERALKLHESESVLAPIGVSVWGETFQAGWIDGTSAYREAIRNLKDNHDKE